MRLDDAERFLARRDHPSRQLRLVRQPLGESRRDERLFTLLSLFGVAMFVLALALVVVHLLGGGV